MIRLWLVVAVAACGSAPPAKPNRTPTNDPDGPHHAGVSAQLKPYLDGEVVSSIVIGLYEAGKREVYGFGKGPGGKPPNGKTLYDLGTLTKIYTGLLLAEAVQRREIELDAPVSSLTPPGVTIPTRENVAITVKHLAMHSSGLPRYPGSLLARKPPPDPFAGYTEDMLYQDLLATELATTPGTEVAVSDFGTGLLGLVLGKKGGGYAGTLTKRVLEPLALTDTVIALPTGFTARKMLGSDDDLKPVPRWTWGALIGAGGVISTVDDSLKLLEAELDAAAGGRGTLRPQMRLSQEAQLDRDGDNEAIGWMIDSVGRLWYDGRTSGFRTYMGFDPKTKRGVVVLASTSTTLVDFLGPMMFDVLDGTAKPPQLPPTPDQIKLYAGNYDFTGTTLAVVIDGRRLYLEGPGEPRHRMAPYGDRGFWIEDLQSAVKFVLEGTTVKGMVFQVSGKTLNAKRLPDAPPPPSPPAPKP